ncbi:putative enoyl-CoA hydratase [Chondrus crispus]|uniref:Putative enoyl-CoA hydratase n=1 Tax=Chondrus crispus TaxID=2769 RepID=R7Q7V2_CHOCR|nr:putative enoyl-CoA hydratase [Chondrus crispus]CDF33903.1 putative enoyl-CoA hydratase [Chondrus crispus]|eukprot:XP_005713722.1 putative enoyl-CoA hydratase [Chondrus crispus]
MGIDYFSENYSLSSSSDDDEPKDMAFNFKSGSGRFTEDRRDGLGSEPSLRGSRKTQLRSFEKLEPRNSGDASSYDENDDRSFAAPAPEIDSVIAEGTMTDTTQVSSSLTTKAPSSSAAISSQDTGRRATDGDRSLSISTELWSVRAEGSMGGGPDRLSVRWLGGERETSSSLLNEDGSLEDGPEGRVDGTSTISVEALKDMWNEMVRRDSETSS